MPQQEGPESAKRGVEVVVPEFKFSEPDLGGVSPSADDAPFGTPDALAINQTFSNAGRHETGHDFFSSDVTDISESSMGTFLTGLLGSVPNPKGIPTAELDEMSMEVAAGETTENTEVSAEAVESSVFLAAPEGNEEASSVSGVPSSPPVVTQSPVVPPKEHAMEPVRFNPLKSQPAEQANTTGMGDLLAVSTVTSFEADLVLHGPPVKKSRLFRR